ncbi:MAG TPA: hypothetical protein VHM31_16405 [Polyangia bacterium]|nr:hypothetical protein [Polyangia bacterium]
MFSVAAALLMAGSLSGCFTAMGYGIGSAADDHRAQLMFYGDDVERGLAPDERVRLRYRDGSEAEGTVVAIRATGGLLLRQAPSGAVSTVPLENVSAVWASRRPASGRTIGAMAGVLLDAAAAVLLVRSELSGTVSVGSFH